MKVLKAVTVASFMVSFFCLWALHFIHNGEISKLSSDIKEIRATVAQQPQERNYLRLCEVMQSADACSTFVITKESNGSWVMEFK